MKLEPRKMQDEIVTNDLLAAQAALKRLSTSLSPKSIVAAEDKLSGM